MNIDVTDKVWFGNPDDESLPIKVCICGKHFVTWEEALSIYPEDPWECPKCGAKLYFRQQVTVFMVEDN